MALIAAQMGLSVHPPTEDGTKAPLPCYLKGKKATWLHPDGEPANEQAIRDWYGYRAGIGLRCGAESRGLEGFEFDCRATYDRFKARAAEWDLGDLVARIEAGYREETPGGGVHWLYFAAELRGNTKLAKCPMPTEADPKAVKTLIETRGTNGFIIIAPSGGRVHPSGKAYTLTNGGLDTIVDLSDEERDALWDLARSFDEMPREQARTKASGRPPKEGTLRPGDEFEQRHAWEDVLSPAGWEAVYTRDDTTYWRRPGKDRGISATTGHKGSDLLYVFSSSTTFESEKSYTKFGAYTVLNHGGDYLASAKCLKEKGYGRSATASGQRCAKATPQAAPGVAEVVEPPRPNEADNDPHRLARIYLQLRCTHPDGHTLVYHGGEFHRWDGAYRTVLDKEIRADLGKAAKEEFDRINLIDLARHDGSKGKGPPKVEKVTNTLVGNVTLNLSGLTMIDGRTMAPSWLNGEGRWPASEVLPTRNGLLHLPSFVEGKTPSMIPPTPNFFCPYATDYDFVPAAPEPARWLAFLHQLWDDDSESIDALQEWFGYHLTPDVSQQKIGTFIGPRRCGKGTIVRVLTALIGEANVCNPTLSGLGTQFGQAILIGKLAAIITDARITGRADIAQVVETLLSISGEDNKTIQRKHLPDWSGKLMTKFSIISNETPRLADSSGALAGRMIMFRLTESFFGREDKDLFKKLLPELPGILLWAIRGWKRLDDRGYFIQPGSGRALVEEMEELSSPIGQFVKECMDQGPGLEVETDKAFEAWKEYCKKINREQVGDSPSFGRNLRTVLPNLTTRACKQGGRYWRVFEGIDLKPPQF